ncbi:MAG TPA: hypothetical protein VJ617_15030 [Arthrobacter sp.]|nr:hypothetical protein [Arthrobacter sp.]
MTTAAVKPQPRQSSEAAGRHRKEVTTMIRKIRKALSALRPPARDDRRGFNGELLDRQREDVFALLHQQMGGLR